MIRDWLRPCWHALLDVLQTAFRMLPWPTTTGLRAVGHPGPASPVLITGNYDLTVRRVLRALQGLDVWLVVAPSQGVNVWCAAAGGHLGTHQVVTAIKTSGIEELVEHRRAILPQLAATGVVAQDVARRTGWRVKFGPVYAHDLPSFLAADQQATDVMRQVRFTALERVEMMTAWAAPTSLALAIILGLFSADWLLPILALTWLLAGVVYVVGLERIPGPRRLLLAVAAMLGASLSVHLSGGGQWAVAAAAAISLGLAWLLSFDYRGSTPNHDVDHFAESDFHIQLDRERCSGAFSCLEVCPEGVFQREESCRKVQLVHPEHCVRCAACIVQCPRDALYLASDDGARITPETVRRFKLNLLGRRAIVASEPGD